MHISVHQAYSKMDVLNNLTPDDSHFLNRMEPGLYKLVNDEFRCDGYGLSLVSQGAMDKCVISYHELSNSRLNGF